jgi:type I restriction enzyme S subunit
MTINTYKEYKNTGVEWLGKLPAHWDVFPLKAGFNLMKRPPPENCGVVTAFRDGEVTLRSNRRMDGFTEAFQEIGYQGVEPNDLVIHAMDAFAGAIGVSDSKGKSTPVYSVCEPKKDYFSRYYGLVLRHIALAGFIQSLAKGIRERSTDFRWSDAKNIPIPHPSIDEQKSIIKFLDIETAKIDTLVAQQEKLIELLKEKRQAVISNAVTKGVDPSIKKKDSGVEWLGEVPDHWKILKIKRLSAVQRGASPRPIDDQKYFDDEGEYGWVRISDVSSSDGILRNTEQKLSVLGSSLSVKIEPTQLFISIAGTVGKPCISAIKACIHDGFVYFPNLKINPWWLFRVFEAGVCYGGLGKLGTQLNLNTDTVGSISIGVPPDQEIESILSFIQITLKKFDGLISEAQRVIDLSLERRSSLISAAVTGQIDVRNYQPKEVA